MPSFATFQFERPAGALKLIQWGGSVMVKKNGPSRLCLAFVFLLPLLATMAFGEDGAPAPSGKQVFETKCLQCHKQRKFANLHYERRAWEQIVARMERNTCVLTDGEFTAVCDYLVQEHGD